MIVTLLDKVGVVCCCCCCCCFCSTILVNGLALASDCDSFCTLGFDSTGCFSSTFVSGAADTSGFRLGTGALDSVSPEAFFFLESEFFDFLALSSLKSSLNSFDSIWMASSSWDSFCDVFETWLWRFELLLLDPFLVLVDLLLLEDFLWLLWWWEEDDLDGGGVANELPDS